MRSSPPSSDSGFTLSELMIASALAGVLMLAFLTGFVRQREVVNRKNLEQELQYNVRNAMGFLTRDLRAAGGGLVMGTTSLNDWFDDMSGVGDIPHIEEGGTGPDALILAGHAGASVATLDGAVSSGSTTLDISLETGNVIAYTPRPDDVLLLGGVEAVQVVNVEGDTITVRTDPTQVDSGVHLSYPDGTRIHQLNRVEYRIETVDGVTGLTRDDSRFTYASDADRLVARDIIDLQLEENGGILEIELTGRTREAAAGFEGEADGRPRYTLESAVHLRNSAPGLNVSGWPTDRLLAAAPTPTPGPTATPEPSPTAGPTPTPAPNPTATPVPAPTATPAPAPTPTPTTRPHEPGKPQHCWCWHVDRGANHPYDKGKGR